MTTLDAVLFDMDGTLVDSDGAVERAWTAWAGEYGVDAAAVLSVAHGSPADRTVRLVRPDLGDAQTAEAAARRLAAGRAAGAFTAALRGLDGDLRLADLAELARLFS